MLFKWFSRLLHIFVFLVFIVMLSHVLAPMMVEAGPIPNAFINEIHYDNIGGDVNEFIEIAYDTNTPITGWSLHFYNGSNGIEYTKSIFSDWLITDASNGFSFASIAIAGIQNGSPDGIVLADKDKNIIQFLSYEGIINATSGIALGLTSIDIGVSESSDTPVGFSLQLTGQGSQYSDFTWASAQKSTVGQVNFTQKFVNAEVEAEVVSIPEPHGLLLISFALLIYSARKIKITQTT